MSRPHITLGQIRECTPPKTFARGQDLYLNKAISETALRGQVIEGQCEAASQPDPYDVQVTFDDNGIIETSCTCLYEFDGACKHAVALLLTYLNAPDRFEPRQPLADVLEKRDKSDLIALIRQMVKLHPDLKSLIDRPVPGKATADEPLDLKAFRKELHRAYGKQRGWGRPGAEAAVESVRNAALEFAEKEDWHSASSIYRMIIEECLAHLNYFYEDEEGWYGESIDTVIAELDVCLSFLVDDDLERQAILNSLTDFYTADIETGGDVGVEAPDIILRYARSQDVAALQSRLRTAIENYPDDPYSEWEVKGYRELLTQLELLDTSDLEVVLTRLRDANLYDLLIEKLLALKRVDEAVAVIREHMLDSQVLSFQIMRVYSAGYQVEAVLLAAETLDLKYDRGIISWLIEMLDSRGDTEGAFRWRIEQMKIEPSISLYNVLKSTAEKLGNWSYVRPTIIEQLEDGKYYGLLTHIYMVEELWDKAWATLPKVAGGTHSWLHQDFRLEIDLALQTTDTHPEKALPVLIKAAHKAIDQRNRLSYQDAARYLVKVRDAYDSMDEFEQWEKLIAPIKGMKPRLPALLEELKKAGL